MNKSKRGAKQRDPGVSSVPERWAPISTLAEDAHAASVASVPGSSSHLDAVTQRLLADLRGSSTTAIRAALERITQARKQGEKTPAHLHMAIYYIFTDARTDAETRRLAALYFVGAALDGLASPDLAARRRAARYIWGWALDGHGPPSRDKFPFVAAAVPAALDDPDEEVRHSATLALLIRNWKGALNYTTDLAEWALRSASPDRRRSAAQVLRTAVGEPDAAAAATALVPLIIEGLLAPDDPSAIEQPRYHAASAAGALIRAGGDVRAVLPHVVGWLSRASAGSGSAWRPCELLEEAAKCGIDISAAVPALEAASARPAAPGTLSHRPAASRALSRHFRNTGQEATLTLHDFTKYLGASTHLELSHRPVHAETDLELSAEPRQCGHCGSTQTACLFRDFPTSSQENLEYRCKACGTFTVYVIFTYDD